MKTAKGKKEYLDGVCRKYGVNVTNIAQVPEIKQKIETHKDQKYGSRTWNNAAQARITYAARSQDDIIAQQDQFKETCIARYGVEHPMKDPIIAAKSHSKSMFTHSLYTFNSLSFDSKPELCFYIWACDNSLTVIRNPDDGVFQYRDAYNTLHAYHCDFKVLEWNAFVEIKGDNHFKDHDPSTGK